MAYGSIKVDNVIYTKGGVDTTITVSGIVDSLSGAISVTGAISGASVSAATGTFTTLSGNTTAGTTATFTSGVFTTFSGTTVNVVSGVFASGTVALPSVSVGTSSNGLYSPGENQLAISTSGTGRLTVDNLGNLGLGVTPSGWDGTITGPLVFGTSAKGSLSYAGSATSLGENYYRNATGFCFVTAAAASIYQQTAGSHVWYSSSNTPSVNGAITFTQAMTLDASGNLGLGVVPNTWSATARAFQFGTYGSLYQNAAGYPELAFNTYQNTSNVFTYRNTDVATRYSQTNGQHRWFTAPSGFGVGTAATSLTSAQNGNSYTIVTAGDTNFTLIGAANNDVGTTFTKSGGTGAGAGTVSQNITFTQAMTLDANGRLALGTTEPNGLILGLGPSTSQKNGINYVNSSPYTYTDIWSAGTSGGWAGQIRFWTSNNAMPSTQAMTLDASGNLGLGVVPKAWGASFNVLDFTGASFASNTAGTATFIAQNAYYDSAWKYKSSTNATLFQTDSGSFQWYTSTNTPSTNGAIDFTQAMTLDASGNLGIGPGATSPQARFHVSGTGAAAYVGQILQNTSSTGYVQQIFHVGSAGANGEANISYAPGTFFAIGPTANDTTTPITFRNNNSQERARIDSSGRLLVGTTSARGTANTNTTAQLQIEAVGTYAAQSIATNLANATPPYLSFVKSRGSTAGSNTLVSADDYLGYLSFDGADGSGFRSAAAIYVQVDGNPGTNDMPGRLVFSTTADGADTPTEELRITNDGVIAYNQIAPVAVDATATLTVANLKAGIITSTTAAAVTMTLPTGTLTEGGFSGAYNNMTFEWSVINTGATNAVTVQAGTGHTLVGSGTVAANNSGRFATRRTAANTWVTYRLSS